MNKIMYIFLSGSGIDKLIHDIIPQIEADSHGIKVVGMCFFDGNAKVLSQKEVVGKRLAELCREKNIQLMVAETGDLEKTVELDRQQVKRRTTPAQCAVITVLDGEQVACFPDLYAALGDNRPDYIISL